MLIRLLSGATYYGVNLFLTPPPSQLPNSLYLAYIDPPFVLFVGSLSDDRPDLFLVLAWVAPYYGNLGAWFTVFDIDPQTAQEWGRALLRWADVQPKS